MVQENTAGFDFDITDLIFFKLDSDSFPNFTEGLNLKNESLQLLEYSTGEKYG